MPEPKDPHDDQRVEELLSQLQGIFSKLSSDEQKEARHKVVPPKEVIKPLEPTIPLPETTSSSPVEPSIPLPPAHEELPSTEGDDLSVPPPFVPELLIHDEPPFSDVPINPPTVEESTSTPSPELPELTPLPLPPVWQEEVTSPPSVPTPEPEPAPTAGFEVLTMDMGASPLAPSDDLDKDAISVAIFYPAGRESDAKILVQKTETLSPKFTKISFRLKVRVLQTYSPKSNWQQGVLELIDTHKSKVCFIITEKPLEEAKRREMAIELDRQQVYFQEVGLVSITKKAFYTDMLLGLVFFFDSQKLPENPGQ